MRVELKKIQAENAALAQKVQAGREAIAETERRISSTVDEWKVRGEHARHKKTSLRRDGCCCLTSNMTEQY